MSTLTGVGITKSYQFSFVSCIRLPISCSPNSKHVFLAASTCAVKDGGYFIEVSCYLLNNKSSDGINVVHYDNTVKLQGRNLVTVGW